MKKKIFRVLSVFLIFLLVFAYPVSAAEDTNYVIDKGKHITTPALYSVERVIDRVSAEDFFDQIENMFIDQNDNLFIADSGNNRIVRFDPNGRLVKIYTAGGALNKPSGMYYDNNILYIADTENERVVCVDENDQTVNEIFKPESDLLDDTLRFDPNNIAVGIQGYIYVLKSQRFMSISQEGDFKGFIGATKVTPDIGQILTRIFASPEQKKKMVKVYPDFYLNFTMNNGAIYAVASNKTSQIRKINMVGDNLYPLKFYGEREINISGEYVYPNFTSIGVANDGIISVLEQYGKKIYQYDQNGNMICFFGGEGEVRGRFVTPISVAVDSKGSVYVADGTLKNIQVFSRSAFADLIYSAMSAYEEGDYELAYTEYRQALDANSNYPIANDGIAKCLYKMGRTDEAMSAFRASENKDGYGQMLVEYREQVIQKHFSGIVFIAALIIGLLIFSLIKTKKYADKLIKRYYKI